jgi:hypothetical protein
VGEGRYVPVKDLVLDGQNPRFPIDADTSDQEQIAVQLANRYDALEIARSIARNGFHAAEPPAVLDNRDGTFTVLEGNRRVTALKGLLDHQLSQKFADKTQWSAAVAEGTRGGRVPTSIPVIVYEDRAEATALLVGRHIKGPKKWEPLQQHRYIHDLVNQGYSFQQTANLMDATVGEVKAAYRNYRLIAVDVPRLGLQVAEEKAKYSVLGIVWDNNALRKHAHVAEKSEVKVGESSIAPGVLDADARQGLGEVLLWVVGDDQTAPVLEDSRQVVKLAQVVSSDVGLAALRSGKSLKEALQQVSEEGAAPAESALRMLTASVNSLNRATTQLELLDEREKAVMKPVLAQLAVELSRAQEALELPADQD